MKFYSRYGKRCRYKFGDIVTILNEVSYNEYIVINANWIGNSNGFWEIELEHTKTHQRIKRLRPMLKKVGEINE